MLDLPSLPEQEETLQTPRPRRPWSEKFRDALRGLKLGIRGHSSFFVHFFFAALVVAAAIVLRCELLEWCLLLGCIGLVLTAELFNSARFSSRILPDTLGDGKQLRSKGE